MPLIATDWTVTRATGDIRYIGDDHGGASPSYATVIEFHRWLQDLADDAVSSGDDELDITDDTPSDRSTDNIITLLGAYNIDANAAEHLYDGSIIQANGDTIYDGIVNFGNADVQIQIIQDGTVLADDWWNFGGGGLNADANAGISHRFMLLVRDAAADIDGRRLIGTCRRFNFTYSEFPINGTSRGNNVLALSDASDLNNQSTEANVAGWVSITNTEGYRAIDVNNDTVDEYFYSEWNEGAGGETGRAGNINDIYERVKWITRDGSAETTYGNSGELFRGITHQVALNTGGANSGTFSAVENVSWSGGTGIMVAIDNATASSATNMWIQRLTGTAPGDGVLITGDSSSATATTDTGALTARTVSTPVPGASTGSALIGSYGFGVAVANLGASDLLKALDDLTYTPPNNVTFTVQGLEATEDYVLVTNDAGSAIDIGQLSLSTTLSGATETSVVVGTIPADTPSAGTIRIQRDNGAYTTHAYSSYTGNTFTIASTDFSTNNATSTNNVYISYIDVLATAATESFTVVYSGDRTLFVRVRDGGTAGDLEGIKTFETTATLGSGGGSTTVIRTSDA